MFRRGYVIFGFVGIAIGGIALAGLFASQVENKPWGVPDVRRAQYDEILDQANLARQASTGEASVPLPKLSYDRRSTVLDERISGDKLSAEFEIRNNGAAPLKLEFASKSDEEIVWDLSLSAIQPRQTSKLTVGWTANETQSKQYGSVRLKSNDPLEPNIVFSVVANVKRPLVVPSTISFGKVDKGTEFSQSFYLTSETTDSMAVVGLQSDLVGFDYSVEPVELRQLPQELTLAKVAYRVTVSGTQGKYGAFATELELELLLDDQLIQKTSELTGQVKSAISFIHPDIHKVSGLEIGIISSKEERIIGVGVQQRGEVPRPLVVLDHFPKELDLDLVPQKSVSGAYQLRIKIREGAPTVVFNRADQRGFVSVGDPNEPDYSEWLPLYGMIVSD